MRREIPFLSVLAAAAPLAVSAPQQHVTEIRVAGGSGSFAVVTRGCEGDVLTKGRADYDNGTLEVSHKFPSAVRVGARAGAFHLDGTDDAIRYANPFFSFDWPGFSIGAGLVAANEKFPDREADVVDGTASGHVRVGNPNFYFSASYFEGVPLATPGYLEGGMGKEWSRVHLWVGLSDLPYDKAGFVTRVNYNVAGRLSLDGTGRLGSSEGINENSFAVGLSYRFFHGSSQPAPAASQSSPTGSFPTPTDSTGHR